MNWVKGKKVFNWSVVILFIVAGVWLWVFLMNPATLAIKTVKVEASFSHISKRQLKQLIFPYVHAGFFNVDAQRLKQQLLTIPWVADAAVTRVWPDTIAVRVYERKPVAYWGRDKLITQLGNVYAAGQRNLPNDLPTLIGPSGQELRMLEILQTMDAQLSELGLHIKQLILSERWAWTMSLSNGMTVLIGRSHPVARIRRFVDAYPQIIGSRGSDVVRADLRYSNGIAIRWKSAK